MNGERDRVHHAEDSRRGLRVQDDAAEREVHGEGNAVEQPVPWRRWWPEKCERVRWRERARQGEEERIVREERMGEEGQVTTYFVNDLNVNGNVGPARLGQRLKPFYLRKMS